MEHRTVNHSVTYVAPDGTHTNTIEGTWAGIKRKVPVRHRTEQWVTGNLVLFIWRRRFANALWDRMLFALSRMRYNPNADDNIDEN